MALYSKTTYAAPTITNGSFVDYECAKYGRVVTVVAQVSLTSNWTTTSMSLKILIEDVPVPSHNIPCIAHDNNNDIACNAWLNSNGNMAIFRNGTASTNGLRIAVTYIV